MARRGHVGSRRRTTGQYYTFPVIAGGSTLGVMTDGGEVITNLYGGNVMGIMVDGGDLNEDLVGGNFLGKMRDGGDLPRIIDGSSVMAAITDGGTFGLPVMEGGNEMAAMTDGGDLFLQLLDGGNAIGVMLDGGTLNSGEQRPENPSNYTVLAMETTSAAVTEYLNFEMELMRIGDNYFGVGPGGLYQVLGQDNDAGADISASFQTGYKDLDSDSFKRCPSFRISAEGSPLVRLKWIDKSGTLNNNTYTPPSIPFGNKGTPRVVDVGRGTKFVYSAVEIVNTNGDDFEVDEIDQYLIVLNRRR